MQLPYYSWDSELQKIATVCSSREKRKHTDFQLGNLSEKQTLGRRRRT
jgi:hypothetical protein